MLWIRDCCIRTIYCEGLDISLSRDFGPEISCCPIFCGPFCHVPEGKPVDMTLTATAQTSPAHSVLLAAQASHHPCQTQVTSSLIGICVLPGGQAEAAG